jgi:protein-S-isoprenylcysteine O-methyltransferase Ste14
MNLHQIVIVIWVLSEILLNRTRRSNESAKIRADKQSLNAIWIAAFVSLPIAHFLTMKLDWWILPSSLITHIGVALIIIGALYRGIAIYTLGRYFTVDVSIRNDHHIVNRGLYSVTRHPSYLGLLLCFFGNALAFNHWAALILGFIPVMIAILYRIKVEEALLVDNFGEEYIAYKKHTWRLIPFVY